MVELKQVTLMKTDVRRVKIDNYHFRDPDGADKWLSQLVIDLETGHLDQREQIRIPLSHEQKKCMYKALKKALDK